jgi:hypothetical protein
MFLILLISIHCKSGSKYEELELEHNSCSWGGGGYLLRMSITRWLPTSKLPCQIWKYLQLLYCLASKTWLVRLCRTVLIQTEYHNTLGTNTQWHRLHRLHSLGMPGWWSTTGSLCYFLYLSLKASLSDQYESKTWDQQIRYVPVKDPVSCLCSHTYNMTYRLWIYSGTSVSLAFSHIQYKICQHLAFSNILWLHFPCELGISFVYPRSCLWGFTNLAVLCLPALSTSEYQKHLHRIL